MGAWQVGSVPPGSRHSVRSVAGGHSDRSARGGETTLVVAARPDHAQLQSLMDELVINGIPGVLATVDDGPGPAWRGASGAARLDLPRVPLRPSARFRVGSITKSMVATVVLQLVGEGMLRLEDSVDRWLPGMVPEGC